MQGGLLLELVKRDFAAKYAASALGVSWALVRPAATLAIYVAVFSSFMGARLPGERSALGYAVYLVAGLLPWLAFSGAVSRAAPVFLERREVLLGTPVPLPALPLAVALSEGLTLLAGMAVVVVFLWASGQGVHPAAALIPVVCAIHQALAFGLGRLAASLHVYLRDLREALEIGLHAWFWLTPVVYVADILPGWARGWLELNPAWLFVRAYQDILVARRWPDPLPLLALAAVGALAVVVGGAGARRLEREVRELL